MYNDVIFGQSVSSALIQEVPVPYLNMLFLAVLAVYFELNGICGCICLRGGRLAAFT